MLKVTEPRCATDTCARCRRKFWPGERVAPIYIVLGTGRSESGQLGVELNMEFEVAHVDCADAKLEGSKLVVVPG